MKNPSLSVGWARSFPDERTRSSISLDFLRLQSPALEFLRLPQTSQPLLSPLLPVADSHPPPPQAPESHAMAASTISSLPVALPVVKASHKPSHAKPVSTPKPLPAKLAALPKLASLPARPAPLKPLLSQELSVSGITALALTAAMLVPDIAEAAQPGLSPSLKNFLLSIVAGGVVLTVIVGAVIAVANFDPVKRT
ncbi:hypothetical protein ACLOJK_034076 [Asimina triloba]